MTELDTCTDCDAAASPETWHPDIRRIHAHWQSMGPAGRLPGRQHFDPLAVHKLLPGIWMLDVQHEPFRLRYRLMGTSIVEAIGEELTGRWLDEVHPTLADRPDYLDRYRKVVETGRPGWRRGHSRLWSNKHYQKLENIVLPLAADGTHVDILMALTVLYPLVCGIAGGDEAPRPRRETAA